MPEHAEHCSRCVKSKRYERDVTDCCLVPFHDFIMKYHPTPCIFCSAASYPTTSGITNQCIWMLTERFFGSSMHVGIGVGACDGGCLCHWSFGRLGAVWLSLHDHCDQWKHWNVAHFVVWLEHSFARWCVGDACDAFLSLNVSQNGAVVSLHCIAMLCQKDSCGWKQNLKITIYKLPPGVVCLWFFGSLILLTIGDLDFLLNGLLIVSWFNS